MKQSQYPQPPYPNISKMVKFIIQYRLQILTIFFSDALHNRNILNHLNVTFLKYLILIDWCSLEDFFQMSAILIQNPADTTPVFF